MYKLKSSEEKTEGGKYMLFSRDSGVQDAKSPGIAEPATPVSKANGISVWVPECLLFHYCIQTVLWLHSL